MLCALITLESTQSPPKTDQNGTPPRVAAKSDSKMVGKKRRLAFSERLERVVCTMYIYAFKL